MGKTKENKGIAKVCPTCGKPMSLSKFGFANLGKLYWICWYCPQMINYSSYEASELKEVEV